MLNKYALSLATAIATVLQILMVVAGHIHPGVASMFAVGGMGLSFLGGLFYEYLAKHRSSAPAAVGGMVAGAICAFIGILVSYMLGNVPASLLVLGTLSSAITGALGGFLGKFISGKATVAATVMLLAVTSTSEAQTVPLATTADFAWLAGRWEGHVANVSGVAEVTFSAPKAGLIVGMMRLVDKDRTLVVELVSLVDTPSGLELRFRHFSPSLTAYETEFKQTMRITASGGGKYVFENLVPYSKTLMSTQPRVTSYTRGGDDSFVGRSEIIGSDERPAVVEVTYTRAKSEVSPRS
jgi:hypothetical protein